MIILFLGGVILGFNQAGEGMDEVRGTNEPTYDALQVSQNENGQNEVEVLGQRFQQQETLEQKKEEYTNIQEDFITEKIAAVVETSVQWLFNVIIDVFYQITQLFYKS